MNAELLTERYQLTERERTVVRRAVRLYFRALASEAQERGTTRAREASAASAIEGAVRDWKRQVQLCQVVLQIARDRGGSRIDHQDAERIRRLGERLSAREIASGYGISRRQVMRVRAEEVWT